MKRIMVMIDADYREKKEVKKWRDFVVQEGAINGFDMVPVSWNPKYKGIDDLYLHMKSSAGNEGIGIRTGRNVYSNEAAIPCINHFARGNTWIKARDGKKAGLAARLSCPNLL